MVEVSHTKDEVWFEFSRGRFELTKSIIGCLVLLSVLLTQPMANGARPQDSIESYTKVGQQVPSFKITDLAGNEINMDTLRGKVVFVNFWATWCAPCLTELPRVEKEIWRKLKSDDFVMIAIAREQTNDEITEFKNARRLTLPMASDPQREIFSLFANGGIPRNYVVSGDGHIVYQSDGYVPSEFGKMKKVIDDELRKLREAKAAAG